MDKQNNFKLFIWRVTALHVVTYFLAGVTAFYLLNYEESFASGELSVLMKPTDSPWVMLGPILNIPRGIVFALVLWPFRQILLYSQNGWLKLWGLFLGLGIFGTFGPTPGSFEGVIFTKIPVIQQFFGLWEVIVQSALLSYLLFLWYNRNPKYLNRMVITFFALICLVTGLGFLVTYGS